MSRPTFLFFFLLLFVCCQLCGQKCAARSEPLASTNGKVIDEFLKPEDDNIKEKLKTTTVDSSQITVSHIDLVSLVSANGVIFAMAEMNYTDNGERKIAVLAKYFKTKEKSWGDEVFGVNGVKWDLKSFAGKDKSKDAVIKSFAVATKGTTIYHITVSNSTFEESEPAKPPPAPSAAKWYVRVVKGTVTNDSSSVTGKKEIEWEKPEILGVTEASSPKKLNEKPTNILPSDGFAFVTDDKNVFFLMKGKTEEGNKNIVAVFEFKDEKSAKVESLFVDISEQCYPSFFEWEEEIIMAPGPCQDENNQNVKLFNNTTKKTFDEIDKPIARLRDFLKDKNNFTTAKIGDINVLLCTQQKKDPSQKSDVYLWMTDGTHVKNVGTIVENIEGTFDGSVLYTKDELIALHQKYNTGSNGEKEANTFSLKRLKSQLDNIKFYSKEWEKSNKTVPKLCENTRNTNIHCTTSPPVAGLVGFLHETTNESSSSNTIIWKDIYYYSNVTVNKGENVNQVLNGLKFSGTGKGAEWSVKNEQNEILYNFTDPGFTLLATVEIGNNTNNNDNSILGMKLTPNTNKNTKNVGLWCTAEGKWGVSYGDDSTLKIKEGECKKGNKYNAALVLKTHNLEIYVNGIKLTTEKIAIVKSQTIEHFYFGGNNNKEVESYVTVTDVLLYNRPFNDEEIGNLKDYVKSVEVVTPPDEAVDTNITGGNSDEPTPPPIPTSTKGKREDEKGPSPSRTEDGGVGGGVRVFSLLLAVLCVSALLLHL